MDPRDGSTVAGNAHPDNLEYLEEPRGFPSQVLGNLVHMKLKNGIRLKLSGILSAVYEPAASEPIGGF